MRTSKIKPDRILTIWQPYATLIARGFKDREFRDWHPGESILPFTCAIHAAKREMDKLPEYDVGAVMMQFGHVDASNDFKLVKEIVAECEATRGHIVAVATVTGFEPHMGGYGWVLEDVRPLVTPLEYRGGQGLRRFDRELTVGDVVKRVPSAEPGADNRFDLPDQEGR